MPLPPSIAAPRRPFTEEEKYMKYIVGYIISHAIVVMLLSD